MFKVIVLLLFRGNNFFHNCGVCELSCRLQCQWTLQRLRSDGGECNIAFWLSPAQRMYCVANARMDRLAVKDNSSTFKYQVL